MRAALLLTITLAGCAGEPSLRFTVPQPTAGEPIRIPARTVEIREVTLPTYADSEEIFIENSSGFISSDPSLLWADEPRRAPEPWPFEAIPDARVEVRVDEMVAGADGLFRFSGQYFIGSPTERVIERSGVFALTSPYEPELGIPSIANARAAVLRDLARLIADQGF